MKILGMPKLKKALQEEVKKAGKKAPSVVTGYRGVNYAVYVHENLEAAHGSAFNAKYAAAIKAGTQSSRGNNQKARFLVDPALRLEAHIVKQVKVDVAGGMSLRNALYRAALLIQRESMREVPVDTGNLRGSAFTEVE